MKDQRSALLSVSDKTGLEEVAKALTSQNIRLLSTGGTYHYLVKLGFEVESVESYTEFPEMMDGRVKTLHPKIHGGLLADLAKDEHQAAMEQQGIASIDFVIVNLYPFKETMEKKGASFEEIIEQIDIGGPAMLRSAAKNFKRVSVVTDPNDYSSFIKEIENKGETDLDYRLYLSHKVFELTSHYDALINQYLKENRPSLNDREQSWPHFTKTYVDKKELRYGENSHQNASVYKELNVPSSSIAGAKQLHGKELSYNNIKDANAAIKIIKEFNTPAAVAVKHMNPCGAALGESIEQAFERCFLADSISIYGGIVAVNRPVTVALADQLSHIFLEIVIAPSFEDQALDILTKKKSIRLLEVEVDEVRSTPSKETVSVDGGILVQETDQSTEFELSAMEEFPQKWEVMTKRAPSSSEIQAMNFLMKVAKHVKSNAVVVGNEWMTLGVGAGQMNRVGAAEIAFKQAKENKKVKTDQLIMASDAFLPMDDTVKLAHDYNVTAIIQPGGSIRDGDSIAVCDLHDMAMVKTGVRHFRH